MMRMSTQGTECVQCLVETTAGRDWLDWAWGLVPGTPAQVPPCVLLAWPSTREAQSPWGPLMQLKNPEGSWEMQLWDSLHPPPAFA